MKKLIKKILNPKLTLEVSADKILEKYPFHYDYNNSITATLSSDWSKIGKDIEKAILRYGSENKR